MSISIPNFSRDAASGAAAYALAVLFLTSVHHAYGGYVYATPWRYHALQVAGVTALVILGSLALLRARPSGQAGMLARGVFALAVLGVPVLIIGVFEGLYNHVIKNVLHFGGASSALMTRLFPPPTYELPNDPFFEITGMLQVVPAALTVWYLYHLLRHRRPATSGYRGPIATEQTDPGFSQQPAAGPRT
jgi:hypothetical protein